MKAGSPGTPGPAGTRKQSGSEDLDKVFFYGTWYGFVGRLLFLQSFLVVFLFFTQPRSSVSLGAGGPTPARRARAPRERAGAARGVPTKATTTRGTRLALSSPHRTNSWACRAACRAESRWFAGRAGGAEEALPRRERRRRRRCDRRFVPLSRYRRFRRFVPRSRSKRFHPAPVSRSR